jgi:hypothetical protein
MTEHPNRTEVVATWVRIGLVALAVPQAVTGLWAILDPSGWFTEFSGFDPGSATSARIVACTDDFLAGCRPAGTFPVATLDDGISSPTPSVGCVVS